RDVATITMDLNSVEHITYNALGGADTVTINALTGTHTTLVTVNLAGTLGGNSGDGAPDTVIMNGTAADDAFVVSGGAGGAVINGLGTQLIVLNAEATDSVQTIGN